MGNSYFKAIKIFLFVIALFFSILDVQAKDELNNEGTNQLESYSPTSFVHPGMMQNSDDLAYMREKIFQGKEPWAKAFANLKKNTSLDFTPSPFTYVSAGSYGANAIGAKEFFESAQTCYNHALMWYITQNKRYADKAIEILNAWSYRLWGFDGNNAKLNVGLNGYFFLNAAEILRYTDSPWERKDIEQFERMLLTVFYPTIQDFFTEANGNWDASIINTIMCIAIFTDNRDMFNRAVQRFYRGEGNSGVTKYIYSGGQCQESVRDWSHVQLGIGELAKVAQVAWTQGLDFYSIADNRLAQGFEYTAKFLLGNDVPAFGELSYRDKDTFRDVYESIYSWYKDFKSIEMPFTRQLIENYTRHKSSVGLLTALRASGKQTDTKTGKEIELKSFLSPYQTGALLEKTSSLPDNAIRIKPGESIQAIIDINKGRSVWIVLEKGIHMLESTLVINSDLVLSGSGKETVLMLNPKVEEPVITNKDKNLQNVIIRDLLIEGALTTNQSSDPNQERRYRSSMSAKSREGILLLTDYKGQMKNILLENITIQNCTKNGISIIGASGITINQCDIRDNGSNVVPGAGFHHNLKLSRSENCKISNSRFVDSLWGNGINISFCNNISIDNNEASRNKLSGINCEDSNNVLIKNNWAEGNDSNGICLTRLMDESKNIQILENLLQNNGQFGIRCDIPQIDLVSNKLLYNAYE